MKIYWHTLLAVLLCAAPASLDGQADEQRTSISLAVGGTVVSAAPAYAGRLRLKPLALPGGRQLDRFLEPRYTEALEAHAAAWSEVRVAVSRRFYMSLRGDWGRGTSHASVRGETAEVSDLAGDMSWLGGTLIAGRKWSWNERLGSSVYVGPSVTRWQVSGPARESSYASVFWDVSDPSAVTHVRLGVPWREREWYAHGAVLGADLTMRVARSFSVDIAFERRLTRALVGTLAVEHLEEAESRGERISVQYGRSSSWSNGLIVGARWHLAD